MAGFSWPKRKRPLTSVLVLLVVVGVCVCVRIAPLSLLVVYVCERVWDFQFLRAGVASLFGPRGVRVVVCGPACFRCAAGGLAARNSLISDGINSVHNVKEGLRVLWHRTLQG